MEYSERLERDAAGLRSELAGSLDELRRRMTPGRILDEAVDYTGDTRVAEFLRNLVRDVRDHPLPLLLIGVGIAWAIIESRRTRDIAPAVPAERIERVKASVKPSEAGRGWLEPHQDARQPEWEVAAVSPAVE